MKRSIFTFLALLFTSTLLAQHEFGHIKGRVLEEGSDEPMPFAAVFIEHNGKMMGCHTDFDGYFILKPVEPGTYTVQISCVGMERTLIENVKVQANKITFLKTVYIRMPYLPPCPWPTPQYRLISFVEPTKTLIEPPYFNGQWHTNEGKFVATSNTARQDLQTLPTGLHVRGGREGNVQYMWEGMRVRNDLNLPTRSIETITVHTSGMPARYGDALDAVIVIEGYSYLDFLDDRWYW